MGRLFSAAETARLRRQFFSNVLGTELSQETADAISDAAAALEAATEANNKAVDALASAVAAGDQAAEALAGLPGLASTQYVDDAVSGLATSAELTAAVSGLASEAYVDSRFALAFTGIVDLVTHKLTFTEGVLTDVEIVP